GRYEWIGRSLDLADFGESVLHETVRTERGGPYGGSLRPYGTVALRSFRCLRYLVHALCGADHRLRLVERRRPMAGRRHRGRCRGSRARACLAALWLLSTAVQGLL